mgnify:FL=1
MPSAQIATNVTSFRVRPARAIGVSVGSLLLFGVVTGLLPNPVYVRMVPRTGLDYLFLVLTAGFLGLYTYQRQTEKQPDDKTAGVSAALGFLAFGCPTCNALLLALFSNSAWLAYFDPLRPVLGGISVLLFAGLLYVRSRRSCERCEEPLTGDRSRDENSRFDL